MGAEIEKSSVPGLPVRVEVSEALHGRSDLKAAAVSAITARVSALLRTLGIPARPEVEWTLSSAAHDPHHPISIYANGERRRYPRELMLLMYSYVLGKPCLPPEALAGLQTWLAGADESLAAEWISLLVIHCLGSRPGFLFGAEHAGAYCAALSSEGLDPERVRRLLSQVLDLGIGIGNREKVAAVLEEGGDDESVAENLIAGLRPDHMELRVQRSYLRWLSTQDGERGPELFRALREGLFTELGVTYPPIRIVADEELRPEAFSLALNHVAGPPFIGLPQDRILAATTYDKAPDAGGEPASNPADFALSLIAPLSEKGRLDGNNITTWDSFQFVILAIAANLRANSRCVVDRAFASVMVERLGVTFPAVEKASVEFFSFARMATILRALVADRISIRDLRRILERLVDHALSAVPGTPMEEQIALARSVLANTIGHSAKKDSPAVVVYLVEPETERLIASGRAADIDVDRFISSVRNELEIQPSNSSVPSILVTEAARPYVAAAIAEELPRVRVLSFTDLPRDINVLPLVRVRLSLGI